MYHDEKRVAFGTKIEPSFFRCGFCDLWSSSFVLSSFQQTQGDVVHDLECVSDVLCIVAQPSCASSYSSSNSLTCMNSSILEPNCCRTVPSWNHLVLPPSSLASTTSKLRCFQSHCCRIRSCCWEARKESPGEHRAKDSLGWRGGHPILPQAEEVEAIWSQRWSSRLSVHEQNQINYSSCVAVLWETQNTFLWGKDLQFMQDLIVAGTVLCCVLPCDSSSVAHCFRAFMLIPASRHKRCGRWFWWLNAMVFEELWIHVHGKNLSGSDQH